MVDISKYSIEMYWDPTDEIYVTKAPELEGCVSHGDTREEALAMIQDAMTGWLTVQEERGGCAPIPYKDVEAEARRVGMAAAI